MTEEDSFVELVKTCARTCHVLKTMSEERSVGSLSDLGKEQIEELGRCVDPVQPPLLTIINDTRTVRYIESAVRESANCARDSQEHYLNSTNGCVLSWRTKLSERLRALEVCGSQFTMPTTSKLPLNYLRRTLSRAVPKSTKLNNTCRGPLTRDPQRLLS